MYMTPFIGILLSVIIVGNLFIMGKFWFYIVDEFREFLEVMEECEQKTCLRRVFSCLIRNKDKRKKLKIDKKTQFFK